MTSPSTPEEESDYQKVQEIYLKWHDGKRPFSGFVTEVSSLLVRSRVNGMKQAKAIVIRRTEIPKDARNPTRDAVVILGEEIGNIIDEGIAALQAGEN